MDREELDFEIDKILKYYVFCEYALSFHVNFIN